MKTRIKNPIAKDLRTPKYKMRVQRSKKNKNSNQKHPQKFIMENLS